MGYLKVNGAGSCNFSTDTANFLNRIFTHSWKSLTRCLNFNYALIFLNVRFSLKFYTFGLNFFRKKIF